MDRHRMTGRIFAGLAVVILSAGCADTSPVPSPATPPSTTAPSAAIPAPAASPSAAASAPAMSMTAIGAPADDGARIVDVATIDARTRDVTIDSPAVGVVKVRLLLPGRFDAQPSRRWPVLYLMHPAMQSHEFWTTATDVAALTASTDLLVVMPDAGDWGNHADWWNGGLGGPPRWETFHLVELRQILERDWRAGDRRAVAGASMGGYGAMLYAARQPGMFRAAASYSGGLDLLGTCATCDGKPFLSKLMEAFGASPDPIWGDPVVQADVWHAHDPKDLAPALGGTRLYVSYGDGTPGPLGASAGPDQDPTGELEAAFATQNEAFVGRLADLGIPVTVDAYAGRHTVAYWERALHRSLPLLLAALD
jgi:S-formylglutathione hydrolase FrmB